MLALIAAILDRGPLYRYADPFGALNLAVMGEGDELQWHFDQTDFVVSLAIQSADRGGDFEVAPRIRSGLRRVLSGRGPGPGRGRRRRGDPGHDSGHPPHLRGPLLAAPGEPRRRRTLRHVGLLAYDTRPGHDGQRPPADGPLRPDRPFPRAPANLAARRGRERPRRRDRLGSTQIGEGFVGSGADAAHLNTVLGARGGPVESAWTTALATPRAGHVAFVCVLQPGLAVKPATLFVNKAPLAGAGHERLTWGAAQAGVAAGMLWAVADGVIAAGDVDDLLLIAAVWVDPGADDETAVYENNRLATREALEAGRRRPPALADLLAERDRALEPLLPVPEASRPAATPGLGPREPKMARSQGMPPSTRRTAPVVKLEASLAK